MSSARLVMLAFFLQPLAFASWLPRIPDVQARLGLSPSELAIGLLGLPLGTLCTLPFAGPLVARIGARAATRAGFALFLIAMCLPAFAFNLAWLFYAMVLTGMVMSILELGLNVTAAETEERVGRAIMSTCHGCWSLGMAAGSLAGVALAALGLAPQWSVLTVAVLVMPMAAFVGRALPPDDAAPVAPTSGSRKGGNLFVPGPLLLGICVFAFGCTLVEGASADWSAIYLRHEIGADAAASGIGYTVFAVTLTVGRLIGDRLKRRFGPVALARVLALTALCGVLLVVFSAAYPVSVLGFALAGLGVSVAFPLGVTAVAGLGDRPAAANVAILSLITLTGFLLGPPVIGFIAEHLGLRAGYAVLIPGLVGSAILAGLLARGADRAETAAPLAAAPIGTAE